MSTYSQPVMPLFRLSPSQSFFFVLLPTDFANLSFNLSQKNVSYLHQPKCQVLRYPEGRPVPLPALFLSVSLTTHHVPAFFIRFNLNASALIGHFSIFSIPFWPSRIFFLDPGHVKASRLLTFSFAFVYSALFWQPPVFQVFVRMFDERSFVETLQLPPVCLSPSLSFSLNVTKQPPRFPHSV